MRKILSLILLVFSLSISAAPGDTTHVITHNQVVVVTNPSTGANSYKAWGVFPTTTTNFRKVYVTMSYKCPPGMNCGEWDYIDQIKVRRKGGVTGQDDNTEIVRFITPYGNTFNSAWSFRWHTEITDYVDMLRDSVEIDYVHTGYETNVGRGWLVTLDFTFIEGTPIAPLNQFHQLWNGSFQYGNTANPIDNNLQPDTITVGSSTAFTKMAVLHSGHGSDNNYCSEFCNRYRRIFVDGALANQRQRWRLCGFNALFPQGGTWVYDRGNWCPGDVVFPDHVITNVSANSTHTYDIDMQTYVGSGSFGNEYINAHLFEYGAISNALDVGIEEVRRPSDLPVYSRMNPVCEDPEILIRNNGSTVVNSVEFKYGFEGSPLATYVWPGSLAFFDTATVHLPNIDWLSTNNQKFIIYVSQVNGSQDNYRYDDTARVNVVLPPVFNPTIIVAMRFNAYPSENSYVIEDVNGNVVSSADGTNFAANFFYRDTITLNPGCYRAKVYDLGGDGLSWWANTAQGTGSFRLKYPGTPGPSYFYTMNSDFGSFSEFYFMVTSSVGTGLDNKEAENLFEVYPNPAYSNITIDLELNQSSSNTRIELTNALGQCLRTQSLGNGVSESRFNFDVSELPAGLYFIRCVNDDFDQTKRIIIQR